MAKSSRITYSNKERQASRDSKMKHKFNSLRNELEGGKISSFDQVFAIVSETRLATELNISFYTFRKKIDDPGEFTITEMMRFAALIGIQYEIIHAFIMERVRAKGKVKVFKE
ncbi:hypothetical protein [Flavitalea sp. BT771]|uniref:hypothetical protein n=2 Tax=Flavitalea sp. BT771 TaxID=3063329 RepID=UPI00294AF505|nr:hypothetical protein [Flavitalea sp. BT771]